LEVGGWSVEEISKRIVKHVYKATSDPELLSLSLQEACKEMVSRAFHGYSSACGDCGWFFDIELVPAFHGAAMELFQAAGHRVSPDQVYEVISAEYEDALDRRMLDKALWEVTEAVFSEDKVKSKVFSALSRAYWPALDEILADGNLQREFTHGLDEQTELRRVENFTRKWLEDGIGRAWASIEHSQAGLNENTLRQLLKHLIAPFGEEHPYSCLPGAFIDRLGRPPTDWVFTRQCITELFRNWNGDGPQKKKRKTNYSNNKKWNGGGEKDEFEQAIMPGEEEVAEEGEVAAEEGEGVPHPMCTSADDCIGGPSLPLMRHVHNGKPGDIYCDACWQSFCQRNPNLKGVPEEQ